MLTRHDPDVVSQLLDSVWFVWYPILLIYIAITFGLAFGNPIQINFDIPPIRFGIADTCFGICSILILMLIASCLISFITVRALRYWLDRPYKWPD